MDVYALLARHEGFRPHPYRDTVGKLTIGYGRNLFDVGISAEEAFIMLKNDVARAITGLMNRDWYNTLDDVRQAAILDMAVNLGVEKLLEFHVMIGALEQKDWAAAATAALQSKWATQVKGRANEIAAMLRTGEWP